MSCTDSSDLLTKMTNEREVVGLTQTIIQEDNSDTSSGNRTLIFN